MKKTYLKPQAVKTANLVQDTKGVQFGGPDGLGPIEATGSVGFYL
jgi:hypothetical protein